MVSLGRTLVNLATETEKTARIFAENHPDFRAEGRERYFRFNVSDGLQDVGLEEYQKTGQLAAATTRYLNRYEVLKDLKASIKSLKGMLSGNFTSP